MITDSVLDIKNRVGQKLTDIRSKWNSFSVNKEQRANLKLQRQAIQEKLKGEKDASKRAEHLANLKDVQEKHRLAMKDSFNRTMLRGFGSGVGFVGNHSIAIIFTIIVLIILFPVAIVPLYGLYQTGELTSIVSEKFTESEIWWDESNPYNIYTAFLEKQKRLAMGEYYTGVEEDSSKNLGLFIESFEPIQKEFETLVDPNILLFAEVRGEALDYEKERNVTFSCEIEKGAKGTAYPPSISFIDLTGGRETVDCTIPNRGLKDGQNIVKFKATFPFIQKAYLLASFIDRDRRNEYIRQDVAFLDTIEKEPKATYTAGPSNIGIKLGQYMPISVNEICDGKRELGCTASLGITIDDEVWQTTGKFNKIDSVTITLPDGIVMQKTFNQNTNIISCYTYKGTVELEQKGTTNIFTLKDTAKLKDISEPLTFQCRVQFNHGKVLGNSPLTPQGIQVEIAYVYEVFKSANIKIKGGISEEIVKYAGKSAEKVYEAYGSYLENDQGIPVEVALAMVLKESSGNAFAVNCAEGSVGLFAFMPLTAKENGLTNIYKVDEFNKLGKKAYGADLCAKISGMTNEEKIALDDRFDAKKNIAAGISFMSKNLKYCINELKMDSAKDTQACVIASHNTGSGNVAKAVRDVKCDSTDYDIWKACLPQQSTVGYTNTVFSYSEAARGIA